MKPRETAAVTIMTLVPVAALVLTEGWQHAACTIIFIATFGIRVCEASEESVYSHIFLIYDNSPEKVEKMATYTHDFKVVTIKPFFSSYYF